MKHSKKIIITATSAGVIGFAGIGASVMAATNSSPTSYPPLVQKIASTFHLDPSKVNDVFKQDRASHQADRQAHLKTTLDQAVKDGKLTQDQEDKLVAKMKTLQDQFKADKTQNRADLKTQLDQWAKDNGITNLSDILPQPPSGMGMHHGMMPDNDGNADDTSGSASTTN